MSVTSNRYIIIGGGYRKYDILYYLKGFSIITIVLMHLIQDYMTGIPAWLSKASSVGGTGVHVFFFCSGFGLFLSQLHKELGYGEFIKKRFLKIYIPYIIIVLISACLPWMFDGTIQERLFALVSHVFLFKMFVPRLESTFGPFWFISTIFQFYLVFIPLCGMKKKLGNKGYLSVCCGLSALWWILTWLTGLNTERIWGSFFLQYLWEFAIGMVVAEYMLNNEELKLDKVKLLIACVIGLGLMGIMTFKGGDIGKTFNDVPALVGYMSLALLLYVAFSAVFSWIGSFSYELYLTHILVFGTIYNFINVGRMVQAVLAYIAAILMARVYFRIRKKLRF